MTVLLFYVLLRSCLSPLKHTLTSSHLLFALCFVSNLPHFMVIVYCAWTKERGTGKIVERCREQNQNVQSNKYIRGEFYSIIVSLWSWSEKGTTTFALRLSFARYVKSHLPLISTFADMSPCTIHSKSSADTAVTDSEEGMEIDSGRIVHGQEGFGNEDPTGELHPKIDSPIDSSGE